MRDWRNGKRENIKKSMRGSEDNYKSMRDQKKKEKKEREKINKSMRDLKKL